MIQTEKERLEHTMVGASSKIQELLKKYQSAELKTAASLAEICVGLR